MSDFTVAGRTHKIDVNFLGKVGRGRAHVASVERVPIMGV